MQLWPLIDGLFENRSPPIAELLRFPASADEEIKYEKHFILQNKDQRHTSGDFSLTFDTQDLCWLQEADEKKNKIAGIFCQLLCLKAWQMFYFHE